jgi:hypothetical protein
MPDDFTTNPYAMMSSFFFPGQGSTVGTSKELRQRLALAMMAQKRKYPTTLGEGLGAIGDSLGDVGMMRRLLADEASNFAQGNTQADKLLGTTPPGAASTPNAGFAPVAAATVAPTPLAGDPDPMSQAAVPPSVQEGAPPKGTTFRPGVNAPPQVAALPARPLPPDQQQSYQPGAPVRMPTAEAIKDFRNQNPLPQNIPPMPDAGRPTVADFGQKPILAPTPPGPPPPVVAQGGDDPRRALALTMLKQGQYGQPQSPAFASATPQPPTPATSQPPQPGSEIRVAPPVEPPIVKAPTGPRPGYVSPPFKEVVVPTPEPMSQQEADLREAITRDPDGVNGQLAKRLIPVIGTLEAARTAENARKVEQYKIDLAAKRTWEQKIEEQKGGAAKDIADVANIQERTRKESRVEDPQSKYVVGPDGVARPLQIEGDTSAPPLPKNEFQLKSVKHYEQMNDAEKIIGEGKALRHGPSALGSQMPVVGGYLQTDAYRKERSAAERWVINKLRQESGAQIAEKEIDREVKAYFPVPSDDAKTVADKTAARKAATEGMMEASGREGKKFLEWKDKQKAAAETASKAETADAVQWLKDHPNDPRAPAVRKRLGL